MQLEQLSATSKARLNSSLVVKNAQFELIRIVLHFVTKDM